MSDARLLDTGLAKPSRKSPYVAFRAGRAPPSLKALGQFSDWRASRAYF